MKTENKNYRVSRNVGKARHVVSFFTGVKFHDTALTRARCSLDAIDMCLQFGRISDTAKRDLPHAAEYERGRLRLLHERDPDIID